MIGGTQYTIKVTEVAESWEMVSGVKQNQNITDPEFILIKLENIIHRMRMPTRANLIIPKNPFPGGFFLCAEIFVSSILSGSRIIKIQQKGLKGRPRETNEDYNQTINLNWDKVSDLCKIV